MLSGPLALLALLVGVVAVLAGCGSDGGAEPADRLTERLVAVLRADPAVVGGDVGDAEVMCPVVRTPDPGDVATCVLRFEGGRRVEVDVEFQADGAIVVVGVVER